jgi:hypothetical protein
MVIRAVRHVALSCWDCASAIYSSLSCPRNFMDRVNVALRVNSVFEENGPNSPTARHCTSHFNFIRVEGNFMGCMSIFR